jgi:hypothetical protein
VGAVVRPRRQHTRIGPTAPTAANGRPGTRCDLAGYSPRRVQFLLAHREDWRLTGRLLGAAEAFEPADFDASAPTMQLATAAADAARQHLGPVAFAGAIAEGRRTPLDALLSGATLPQGVVTTTSRK